MRLDPNDVAYLSRIRGAAMITLRPDGTAHAVRVGVALVDGKLWSSGVPSRARTRNVRRDPRATLFMFDQQFGYLTIESTVRVLEGPDVADLSVLLFRTMQAGMPHLERGVLMWEGKELTPDQFRQTMVDEQRLIYEFEPLRAYGMHA
jgi:PPOX class probable F420-dependent enzyme